jgi:hypothetical protein
VNGRFSCWVVGLAVGAASLLAQASETPLARLVVSDKRVGWDGIELGMSVVQVERRLDTSLALSATKRSCGAFLVDVERNTLRLTLGFPSAKPGAKVESIYVNFEGYQVLADRDKLVAELKRVAPAATFLPSAREPELTEATAPNPAYSLGVPGDFVAVVEPGAGLRLTTGACAG